MSALRWPARPAWLPRLTLRGGIFLGTGAVLLVDALVINRRDLLFVACLLVMVPVVAVVSVALRPARVHAVRVFRPAIVPAGGDTVVAVQLRNLSARPISGARWRDTPPAGITVPDSTLLPTLDRFEGGPDDGADTVRLEYTVTPPRRGLYEIGPLMLGRHDPFGLAFVERPEGEANDLVVTPRVTPLPGSGLSITSGDGSMHELLRHLNPSSDELIAREYRSGDPLRRVNWAATARHGEIMVRQEEQRSNPEARILLDTTLGGRTEHARGGAHERRLAAFELAIELTASLGMHLLDAGFRVQVIELGPSQLVPGAGRVRGGLRGDAPVFFRSPGGDRLLLEGLAGLVPVAEAEAAESAGEILRAAGRSTGGQVPTFAVLVDISAQDALELAALRSHSDPAVAFVLEPMRRDVFEQVQDAGWQCIGLRTARDIPAAWDEVQRERGSVHDPS